MLSLEPVLVFLAILALLGVIFEEVIHVNKAKVTLFFGTLSWMLLFVFSKDSAETSAISVGLAESIAEIAGLWLFLVAAMTFVAYLNKKGMIENVVYLIMPKQVSERKLLFLTGLFCFIFSSLADNITATLVSCSLILSLDLELKKRIQFITLVVFAVNSGGVSLITGDVTTLMIFLADKVEILTLLTLAIPASITVFILAIFLSRGLTYAVGVGGSLLVIGSAAGIVAMSKIPGLTFATYMRYLGHLLLAYTLGYAGVFMLGRFIH